MMSSVLPRSVMGGVCRRALAAAGVFRVASTRRSLPEGFRSPQAVADAVSASLTAETASETSGNKAANNGTKPVKMERRHLEGDVVATKGVTGQQLLQPRNTPDWQVITAEHFANVPVPKGWAAGLEQLQERIGVQFTDVTLLQSALTHHGVLPLNVVEDDVPVSRLSNRSLEFLGDSLLGAAAASYLFQMQPQHQEGQLTRAKSALVKNETLATISEALGITDLLLWPVEFRENKCSMMPTYVKGRVTIAAGALEAVIAAIYLDKGMEAALDFISAQVLPRSVKYATREVIWEPVVELQNLLQAHCYGQPMYKHLPAPLVAKEFTVELFVKGRSVVKAGAPSYKLARSRAAEAAYWHFEKLLGSAP